MDKLGNGSSSKNAKIDSIKFILDKNYVHTGTRTDMGEIKLFTKENIKYTKGNIQTDEKLLNKYQNVKEIFKNEVSNYDGNVKILRNIDNTLKNGNYDLNDISSTKKAAIDIFDNHNNKNEYINNGNKILVSKTGIEESIEKIFNNREQRKLLTEHLKVFSDLGDIIKYTSLVNQASETKNRVGINKWNYYFDGLDIDGIKYSVEFEVRSMENGQNQYRLQRLELKENKKTDHYDGNTRNSSIVPPYSKSVYAKSLSQNDKDVKLPSSKYSMQSDNKWQEHLDKNFKPTRTRTDMSEIKVSNKILNKNLLSYSEEEVEKYKNGRVEIAHSVRDVGVFVSNSLETKTSNKKLFLGKIGKTISNKIKRIIGIDIENYNLSLQANAVKHTINTHGNAILEAKRGQIAVVSDDFNLLPEIITDYDSVKLLNSKDNSNGKVTIQFAKIIDRTYYAVTYVSDKNHTLELKTMWKTQKKELCHCF